jgi:hypothetical protein
MKYVRMSTSSARAQPKDHPVGIARKHPGRARRLDRRERHRYSDGRSQPTLTTVTVAVLPLEPAALALYAKQSGFFERQGIDARITVLLDRAQIVAAVLSGDAQFSAFTTCGLAISEVARRSGPFGGCGGALSAEGPDELARRRAKNTDYARSRPRWQADRDRRAEHARAHRLAEVAAPSSLGTHPSTTR